MELFAFKTLRSVRWVLLLLAAPPAWAQAQPAADDDLEVPAAPGTAAPATPPPAAPATTGSSPAPTPPTASQPVQLPATRDRELAELEQRIAALEAERAASKKPAAPARRAVSGPVGPERQRARPLPLGFRIGGYLQAQFEHNQLSEDQVQQGGELLNQDRFLLRRGRIRIDRGWQYAAGTLELDANTVRGVAVGIRRAEASLVYRDRKDPEALPLLAATLGITDLPFGYEINESTPGRWFMERTLGSSALFPTEADIGLKLWGAASFLRYGLAVSNGEPLDSRGLPRDPNAAKDVTGRLGVDVTPAPVLSVSGGTSFATGRGFHRGQGATKDSLVWADQDASGTVDPLTEIVAVPGSAASPSKNFSRWALGLDLELAFHTSFGDTKVYGEAFVASNYDRGFVPADPVTTGIDVRHTGAYAALLQDVTKYGVVGFRFSYYDPNSDILEQRKGEFLPLDQSVITLSPLIGLTLREQAVRLVFQYDIVRDNLGRDTLGVPADAKNDALTLRLQVGL